MLKKTVYYLTHWESWHWFAKYLFIGPVWLWYCLKARSLWFYSSCNPKITFGGYIGDEKGEAYKLLPEVSCPASIFINPSFSLTQIVRMMDEKGLAFPVAAKAASGIMGFMFRKIDTLDHLKKYHDYMPVKYILQEYVRYPLEVSVFYYRYPHHQKGTITGFIKKELPEVTGDGKSNLWQLICAHPRMQFKLDEMKHKHARRLNDILAEGEHYPLSQALNLSRGGKLVSLEAYKDERLLKVFDDLSHHSGQLFFGRYDLKCNSIEDLKEGRNYKILEFNGCGGEPHHVYGNGNTLWKACRILLHHWKVLYDISTMNHNLGYKRWPHRKGLLFIVKSLKHIIRLKKLDKRFSLDESTTRDEREVMLSKAIPDLT